MLRNKPPLKQIAAPNDFQNKGPEYAIIQFSKLNVLKVGSVWVLMFFALALFGFLVGRMFEGQVNYQISQLDATISVWGFLTFVLALWFLSYTRRFYYALSFTNYIHTISLTLVFAIPYLLYKLHLFGSIDNSLLDPVVPLAAVRTLFYVWMALYTSIILSWYLTTFLSRSKYKYAFIRATFLLPSITLFLTPPLYIANWNSSFALENELACLIVMLILLAGFVLTVAFLSKYQTLGQSNLRIVNRIFGTELSYATFGAIIGAFSYQTYWTASELTFSLYAIIAVAISTTMTLFFLGMLIYRKRKTPNSFFNKVVVKIFIVMILIMTVTLIHIASNSSEGNFATSLSITIPAVSAILLFLVIAGAALKLIVFERWPMITRATNFTTAFLFIFVQALIATLADGRILYDWLGHFLVMTIFSIYLFIEIITLLPDLLVILVSTFPRKRIRVKPQVEKGGTNV